MSTVNSILIMLLLVLSLSMLLTIQINAFQLQPVIDLSQSSADVEIYGASVADYSGSLVGAGDFDGDGLIDILVYSRGAEPLGGTRIGELNIIWGWGLLTDTVDLSYETHTISRVFGSSSDNGYEAKLACGDFNKDGYDDMIFGQPLGPGLSATGIAYVILGGPSFPDTLDLQTGSSNVIKLLGWAGSLGWDVAAGDLNGDGYDEIIASAPRLDYAEIYVIHGNDVFNALYDMGTHQTGMTRIIDDRINMYTGTSLSCGDLDSDGYDDIIMGAPEGLSGQSIGGAILLYGQSNLPDTLQLSNVTYRVQRFFGELDFPGRFGSKVEMAEVNGDNALDLVIGAPVAEPFGCRECGIVYIFFNNGFLDSVYAGGTEVTISRVIGEWWWANCGAQITCADLTGDGRDEIVLPNYINTIDEHTFVIYGDSSMPDTTFLDSDTLATRILARSDDESLGSGLTSGDFNNNGISDLALGADFADPLGRGSAGMTYVIYGFTDPSGITSSVAPPFILHQNFPNPFSSNTTISYSLNNPSPATLTIYNIRGQRVAQISEPNAVKGLNTFNWYGLDNKGRKVASGLYFYRLEARGFSQTKKMVLLR